MFPHLGFFYAFRPYYQIILKIFLLVFTRVTAYFLSFYEKTLKKVLAIQILGIYLLYQITIKTKKHETLQNKLQNDY